MGDEQMTVPAPDDEYSYLSSDGVLIRWPPCGFCGRGVRHRCHEAGHAYRRPETPMQTRAP